MHACMDSMALHVHVNNHIICVTGHVQWERHFVCSAWAKTRNIAPTRDNTLYVCDWMQRAVDEGKNIMHYMRQK